MANASIYAAFEEMWTYISARLGSKVDKVDGKELSSNDYTDEDKNKLDNLETLVGDTSVSTQINETMEITEFITIDDIDSICGAAIYSTSEVTF